MALKVDTSGFERALKDVLSRIKTDVPTAMNGHAIAVITKAAQLTPKADKGSIPYKLYSEVTNRGRSVPVIYLLINARAGKGKGLNNDAMRTAAKKLIGRRVASIGFNAYAGWQNALVAMGGRGFGSKGKKAGFEASSAADGKGRKATVASLVASFSNTAAWIEHIGQKPLQEALNAEEANMQKYLDRKIAETCRRA